MSARRTDIQKMQKQMEEQIAAEASKGHGKKRGPVVEEQRQPPAKKSLNFPTPVASEKAASNLGDLSPDLFDSSTNGIFL